MMNQKKPSLKYHELAAILLAVFAFYMAALISDRVFEHLPHLEDELAYTYQAKIFARGDLVIDTPEPRRAFWQPFVVDYTDTGNRFGKYSPGWPALLAIGFAMGQPWVMNAFFAMLTVALVYRLGREVFNPETGLAAAALMAFSPMALLLNATLMGHTAALFCFTLFMYTYWRIERKRHRLRWGLLAGVALGILIINRPLSAVGVVLPFILWSGFKVLRALRQDMQGKDYDFARLRFVLAPLVLLAIVGLFFSLALPIFNNAATGDPEQNLYTLVWDYDQVGFGDCCGRSGHTIIKGVRHARYDLSMMAADLFGFQIQRVEDGNFLTELIGWELGEFTPELEEWLRTRAYWWQLTGLSLFILPIGLWVGFKNWWMRGWLIVALAWVVIPTARDMEFLKESEAQIWQWLAFGAFWMPIPPFLFSLQDKEKDPATRWTWLLLGVFVGLVGIQLGYWIGSQRYSVRYYYESLTALTLIAALPIGWLIRTLKRRSDKLIAAYIVALLLAVSLHFYSVPRINALYRFNQVSPELIEQVKARRDGTERPVLVLVNAPLGTVSWRAYGTLMSVTGPYLDDEIIVALNYSEEARESILERFPERQIIEATGDGTELWFED